MAKSRLALITPMAIPGVELQATMLATRQDALRKTDGGRITAVNVLNGLYHRTAVHVQKLKQGVCL